MTFFPGLANQDMARSFLQSRAAARGSLGALRGDFLFFRADTYLNSNKNYLFGGYRLDANLTATTTPRYLTLPVPCIISNLYVQASLPGVGTGNAKFTLESTKGGVAVGGTTGLECVIPIVSDPNSGEDNVHTYEMTVALGTLRLAVERFGGGTYTTAPLRVRGMVLYTPT